MHPILSSAVSIVSLLVLGPKVGKRERERKRTSCYKKRSSVRECKGSASLSGLNYTKRLYYVSTLIFLVSPSDPVVARRAELRFREVKELSLSTRCVS